MYKSKIDVPVLLIFFSRPDTFEKVFKEVKKARPSVLLLYQDGPREENDSDVIGIEKCRAIAENIDWDCVIYKFYQDKNMGCDPSGYIAHTWAFSIVDKCIILEDDVVPSQSFFPFCKELLDKYENDSRINIISGINHVELSQDVPYDYFFSSCCMIWGWASWKRVIDNWDRDYSFLDDKYKVKKLNSYIEAQKLHPNFIKFCEKHKTSGKPHFESILIANCYLNSGINIVPKKNMIVNIGATADSAHFSGSIKVVPHELRKIFTLKKYEIELPLNHPDFIMEDMEYKKQVYKIMGWRHPIKQKMRVLEGFLLKLRYGDFQGIINAIKRRINM